MFLDNLVEAIRERWKWYRVLVVLHTPSTMHFSNYFRIESETLYLYCFSRVKIRLVLKSVEGEMRKIKQF